MHVSELTAFPGIGEKIAVKLIDHFGSEQVAMEVLRQRDVASLAEVPGISEKYAVSIIHQAIAHQDGVSIEDFLQTPEAMNVYDKVIGLIRSYSHTQYSRAKLQHVYPLSIVEDRSYQSHTGQPGRVHRPCGKAVG